MNAEVAIGVAEQMKNAAQGDILVSILGRRDGRKEAILYALESRVQTTKLPRPSWVFALASAEHALWELLSRTNISISQESKNVYIDKFVDSFTDTIQQSVTTQLGEWDDA